MTLSCTIQTVDRRVDQKCRAAVRRTRIAMAMLLVIVLATVGSWLIYTIEADRSVNQDYAEKLVTYTEAAQRVELVKQLKTRQRHLSQEAELAASLLEKKPRSVILAEVTNSLPEAVSLLEVTLESGRHLQATPVAIAEEGTALRITGIASDDSQVRQCVQRLNQSGLMRGVSLTGSTEFVENGNEVRKFQIQAFLNLDRPTLTPGEDKTARTSISE